MRREARALILKFIRYFGSFRMERVGLEKTGAILCAFYPLVWQASQRAARHLEPEDLMNVREGSCMDRSPLARLVPVIGIKALTV